MSLRIGIDTGGTFTDVVAIDGDHMVATKTPSIPDDPARALLDGLAKVLELLDNPDAVVDEVSHGTTVATNALLEEAFDGLGLLVTGGQRHVLEIARQSVPDGYGNSYFWTKPDRIVPLHLIGEVPERLDHRGAVVRPLDTSAVETAVVALRDAGVGSIAVSLLHSYADPAHEQTVRDVVGRVHPAASISLSSDVLREYREYERTLTTAVDAAVKPRMARYLTAVAERLSDRVATPLRIMTSGGGVASAARAAQRPITTVLSGPAAGAVGAGVSAGWAGRSDVLTLDGGGTSTDVALVRDGRPDVTTEGRVGRFAIKIPMVDVVTVGTGGGSIGWRSPEGRLRVGPRSAGASPGPLCYGQGGTEPTVTDAHLILGRIPAHLLGGEIPLDVEAAGAGLDMLAASAGLDLQACAAGLLEIAAWNQANAIRQVSVNRGIDLRDLTLVAFGGSGPLQACRLVELLGLPEALVPPDPGNLSAFGLLTVDVRADEVRTHVTRHTDLDHSALATVVAELEQQVQQALVADGFDPADLALVRSADLRYHGQAAEVRVDAPPGPVDQTFSDATVRAFHDAHRMRYGYAYPDRTDHPVEWVNVRVTGLGPTARPTPSRVERAAGPDAPITGHRRMLVDGAWHDAALHDRTALLAGHRIIGPAVVEEFGSTVPILPGFLAEVDPQGNLVITGAAGGRPTAGQALSNEAGQVDRPDRRGPPRHADPVTVEIIKGVLASVEAEVEEAIARTARSPMIRDAHDFRAGIHDRRLRKLTGRSYSALVHPVARDFPLDTMRPGDVFFHNDVYSSEGGIGHLPDLCVTVPVFHDSAVVAFVQAFGHHDDIGGAVPGSMPSHATSVFQEGLMVPPIKLWDAGVPNAAALRIMTRNSRLPDSLAGDLDAEANACRMGADRLSEVFDRYGQEMVEGAFDAILGATAETYRREVLSRIPDGTWTWEDYAEHDGVDPPRLHRQRITLTKAQERLCIDFTGTGPQARGPINHAGDYADGNFLIKWLAPVLRNLAESPERMAELDVDEGVVELIDMVFPPKGTLLTPVFPAPTNARTFVILRLLGVFAGTLAKATGGRMPADQETIRYTGVYGEDADGVPYLFREVLGGGSGGKPWGDGEDTIHIVPDSRNIPGEFVEARFPLRVERLGLATDSGGAGQFRGGLGYDKHLRMLRDAHFMSIADRSILSCWGVAGGRAGAPFQVTIDPDGPRERVMDGLVDDEPVAAGEIIRIRTTGGGGWGDPLQREPERVRIDVQQGKVSADAAHAEYGVVLTTDEPPRVDEPATEQLRARMREQRGPLQEFDRGPGYDRLAGTERTSGGGPQST